MSLYKDINIYIAIQPLMGILVISNWRDVATLPSYCSFQILDVIRQEVTLSSLLGLLLCHLEHAREPERDCQRGRGHSLIKPNFGSDILWLLQRSMH